MPIHMALLISEMHIHPTLHRETKCSLQQDAFPKTMFTLTAYIASCVAVEER